MKNFWFKFATWLLVALMLGAGQAWALDLAGYTIGDSFPKTAQDDLYRGGASGGYCLPSVCMGHVVLGNMSGQATVYSDDSDRIQRVSVSVRQADFAALAKAARAKYGKPSETRTGYAQNAFSAKFSDTHMLWRRKDGTVTVLERCGEVDTSCISITARGYIDPDGKRQMKL